MERSERTGQLIKSAAMPRTALPLWMNHFHNTATCQTEKKTQSGASSTVTRLGGRYRQASYSGAVPLNSFPFGQWRRCAFWFRFRKSLGTTHPPRINLQVEPFRTSESRDFIWIVATNTKICTNSCSSHLQRLAFGATATSLLLVVPLQETTADIRELAWASSIFRARQFGRWVVTRSRADSDFHGHRPAVFIVLHLSWYLWAGVLIPYVSVWSNPHRQFCLPKMAH